MKDIELSVYFSVSVTHFYIEFNRNYFRRIKTNKYYRELDIGVFKL